MSALIDRSSLARRDRWPLALLAALALSPACVDSAGDGEDEGTGDGDGDGPPQACIDPGSFLLEDARPAPVPGENPAMFSCSSGWASDAPAKDAAWTLELGRQSQNASLLALRAHPGGGVVVAGGGVFARYDADGEIMWDNGDVTPLEGQTLIHVEASGDTLISVYDWMNNSQSLLRFAPDGSALGQVDVPWNSPPEATIFGLDGFGDDLIIGAFDLDAEGSWEATLIRLDPMGAVTLRKSTNMTNGQLLAVNDSGTAAFGIFPTFLVSLDNGAVLGNLTQSAGGPTRVSAAGDDFYMSGNANQDFSVGRYSGSGTERWLQTYDRANLGDRGMAVVSDGVGRVVAVGNTQVLDFSEGYWFFTQPWVVETDLDGNAVWADRISAQGDATGVAMGSGGEVYVVGAAEVDTAQADEQPELLYWLRKYE